MGEHHLKGSEKRLWSLIGQRAEPGADVEGIDRQIWGLYGETWAIMFTDLSGFSRGVKDFGILHFLQLILEHQRALDPIIAAHNGILIKIEADSLMVIFRETTFAVRCAVEMQRVLETMNVGRAPEDEILLCIGIGYGPILRIGDVDVYGQQVNAASKLGEDTAGPREILLTDEARLDAASLWDGPEGWVCELMEDGYDIGGSWENYRLKY